MPHGPLRGPMHSAQVQGTVSRLSIRGNGSARRGRCFFGTFCHLRLPGACNEDRDMKTNANPIFRRALGAGTIMLAVGLSGCVSHVGSHGYPRAGAAAVIDYYHYPTADVYFDIHGASHRHREPGHRHRVTTLPPSRKAKGPSHHRAQGPENRDSTRRRGSPRREVARPADRQPRSHPSTTTPNGRRRDTREAVAVARPRQRESSEWPNARRSGSGDRPDAQHRSGHRGDNGDRRSR